MSRLFIWFMVYSFIGWTYETAIYSIKSKKFVDSGMLYGCYCPIYGLGSLMNITMFGGVDNPILIFLGAMGACSVLEYLASWWIERIYGARWWDYSDWPVNLNGRVCLFGSMAFGIMAVFAVKCLHPAVAALTDLFPDSWLNITALLLLAILLADIIASLRRYHKMERGSRVNIVLKLPFDFLPGLPKLGSRIRGITSAVIDNGYSIWDRIKEKIETLFE